MRKKGTAIDNVCVQVRQMLERVHVLMEISSICTCACVSRREIEREREKEREREREKKEPKLLMNFRLRG